MKKKIFELKNISHSYGDLQVIDNLNLYVRENEFITLLGPSGCGKSTLIRMLGGFIEPTSGEITYNDKVINKLPPNERPVNTVFQKYALFPHLNVFKNIAFGLKMSKVPKAEINERVTNVLKLVKLEKYAKRNIDELSGGQQQRVAIARALVNKPKVLLLDEPLAALDLKLRQEMQYELKEMQREVGITFVFVTHDQEEALTMSDTIVVLNDGVIQQIGTPEDIYNEPKNRFVADFIGESNIIEATYQDDLRVEFLGYTFDCIDSGFAKGEAVDVIIRPEDIQIVAKEQGQLVGKVDSYIFKGVVYEINVMVGDKEITIHSTKTPHIGDLVGLTVTPEDLHVIKAPPNEEVVANDK